MPYKRPFTLLIFAFSLLLAIPYLFVIVGDAQVHLAVAENFINNHPFQYNPNEEIVVASTSPFWTLLLVLFYASSGYMAPLLLKITVVGLWLGTAVLLNCTVRDRWQLTPNAQLSVLSLWLGHTTVVANALGGLENILSALQLLWLYYLITPALEENADSWSKTVGLGLLIGWAILTRPDGGFFALTLYSLYALRHLWKRRNITIWFNQLAPRFLVTGIVAVVVLTPWYLYQYRVTGQLVTDSSLARLYNGRLGSLMLIPNQLYLHPKAFISLSTAFLPLSFGFLIYCWVLLTDLHKLRKHEEPTTITSASSVQSVCVTLVGFLFYTFIVGAEAFGRYFLPLYPFLFLAGVAGLQQSYDFLKKHKPQLSYIFLSLTFSFLFFVSLLDSYRRLVPGQFSVTNTLDIIYGPAHQKYISFNLFDLIMAPQNRTAYTDSISQQVSTNLPLSIAVTEVQLRYFLDERINIISLDGRASADILSYINPTTGVPDFARYFQKTHPTLVHINQWCTVGGFLTDIFPTTISDNLICQWQKTAENLAIGDTFAWEGHTITLVAPEIVKIGWQ